MFVTGLDNSGKQVTLSTDVFYTKDRTHRLQVDYFQGCTFRGRNGSTFSPSRVYIRIYSATGAQVGDAWNGYPTLDDAKAALRALSSDGKIYDEEGWDGVFVNGEVVLY